MFDLSMKISVNDDWMFIIAHDVYSRFLTLIINDRKFKWKHNLLISLYRGGSNFGLISQKVLFMKILRCGLMKDICFFSAAHMASMGWRKRGIRCHIYSLLEESKVSSADHQWGKLFYSRIRIIAMNVLWRLSSFLYGIS